MSKEGTSDRLPSFKGPRDLTLTTRGGTAPRNKRVFTPNIPPKRDRGSNANQSSTTLRGGTQPSTSSSSQYKPPPPPSPRGGRGRGRGKREFIQSDSVFGEGVGDPLASRKSAYPSVRGNRTGGVGGGGRYGGRGGRGGSGGSGGGGGGKSGSSVTKETLDDLIKVEQEEVPDQRVFGGDENFAEFEEKDDPNVPVVVPLTSYVPEFYVEPHPVPRQEITTSPQMVGGVQIKSEKKDPERFIPETPPIEPTSLAHVLAAPQMDGTIFLLQLPDQLPVLEQIPESNETRPDRKNSSSNPNAPQAAGKSANSSKGEKGSDSSKLTKDLRTLPEGYIGKIQILASGKTRFVLGENLFEVESGKPVGFRQDLVSINLEDERLMALGPVSHKFVCTPDIDALLRDIL